MLTVDPAVEKMLTKVKFALMMRPNTVFYTTLLWSLKYIWEDKETKTAAVDGVNLWINPNFFASLTIDQQMGLLIHEVLHVALQHMTRIKDRDPDTWNEAADYVINLAIVKAGYQIPQNGLLDYAYLNLSTEDVYEILWAEKQKQGLSGGSIPIPGIGKDIVYPTDATTKANVQENVKEILLRATTASKLANEDPGSVPGDVLLQLEKILNPKLPWNVILRNYFTEFAKDDYSLKRPNRRFMPQFYLPSAYSEAVANLTFALDGSGSVRPKQFSYFISEASAIQQYLKPDKMTMIVFDTRITGIHDITHNTNLLKDVKFRAGGGTDIREVFDWANKNKPEVLLVFTDGDMRVPSNPPEGVNIIWLIHNHPRFNAPYGEIIHYDI